MTPARLRAAAGGERTPGRAPVARRPDRLRACHRRRRPGDHGGRRSLAALTAALAVAFVAVAADAHAQAGCSDVVATWSSGAQEVVGTTCDDPSGGRADESAPAPDPAARDV